MGRRPILALAAAALLAALGTGAVWGRKALADDAKPAGGAAAPPAEEPALEGEAKAKYDADMERFAKRMKSIKNREPLLQFLSELEADKSRAARDYLMQYGRVVKSDEYRKRAFQALAKIGGPKAVAFLCGKDGIKSGDFLVQQDAVEALALGLDKHSVEPMLALLLDPLLKIEIIGSICIALGKIAPKNPKVEEALFREAEEKRDTIRANAVEALGYVGSEKAYQHLVETLRSEKNTRVRAAAATGLGYTKRHDAIPALKAAADGDKSLSVKDAAVKSLHDLGATGR